MYISNCSDNRLKFCGAVPAAAGRWHWTVQDMTNGEEELLIFTLLSDLSVFTGGTVLVPSVRRWIIFKLSLYKLCVCAWACMCVCSPTEASVDETLRLLLWGLITCCATFPIGLKQLLSQQNKCRLVLCWRSGYVLAPWTLVRVWNRSHFPFKHLLVSAQTLKCPNSHHNDPVGEEMTMLIIFLFLEE